MGDVVNVARGEKTSPISSHFDGFLVILVSILNSNEQFSTLSDDLSRRLKLNGLNTLNALNKLNDPEHLNIEH